MVYDFCNTDSVMYKYLCGVVRTQATTFSSAHSLFDFVLLDRKIVE